MSDEVWNGKDDRRGRPYNNMDQHWHLSRSVNLSHILTTVGIVVSGIVYVGEIDKRVDLNGAEIRRVEDIQHQSIRDIEEHQQDIKKKY